MKRFFNRIITRTVLVITFGTFNVITAADDKRSSKIDLFDIIEKAIIEGIENSVAITGLEVIKNNRNKLPFTHDIETVFINNFFKDKVVELFFNCSNKPTLDEKKFTQCASDLFKSYNKDIQVKSYNISNFFKKKEWKDKQLEKSEIAYLYCALQCLNSFVKQFIPEEADDQKNKSYERYTFELSLLEILLGKKSTEKLRELFKKRTSPSLLGRDYKSYLTTILDSLKPENMFFLEDYTELSTLIMLFDTEKRSLNAAKSGILATFNSGNTDELCQKIDACSSTITKFIQEKTIKKEEGKKTEDSNRVEKKINRNTPVSEILKENQL